MIYEQGGRWHVEVDGPNGAKVSKSFSSQSRAMAWESRRQRALAHYAHQESTALSPFTMTLDEALERYGREVSANKRGAQVEAYRLGTIRKAPIAALTLAEVTSKAIADYRNDRMAVVGASSVRSELSLLRRTIETARREWGVQLPTNPVGLVTLPPPGPARDRRLRDGELEGLLSGLEGNRTVQALVEFAIETAMRRGELLALKWRDVQLAQGVVHIPMSKNGKGRHVPLTDRAIEVLEGLAAPEERVFPLDIHALRWAWTQACSRAEIRDLRFHDLRHEGCSRLFEMGLSVPEVASISGHKTPAQLFRYTHPSAAALRQKLRGRSTANP